MDADLERRMELFQETGQVSPEVARFVRGELEGVAGTWDLRLEEESAGMMVSHLLLALERVRTGEAIEEWEGAEDAAEELAEHPWAVEEAQRIVRNARSELGADLPEREMQFLALHLAAVAEMQGAKPKERAGVKSQVPIRKEEGRLAPSTGLAPRSSGGRL